MRYSKALLVLALLASSGALAQAPQINDVQLRPGSSTLWGAAFNTDNNQVISQYNTAGSVVDSFCWYQGSSISAATKNFCTGPTGSVFGAATGGRMGAGTINAVEYYKNGVVIGGGGGTPGGSAGQIQFNDAGAFGGFTTSGDATINTGTGALTLATVNANVGTFGSATTCITTTQNAKGLTTAISAATCTPALSSITGFGTGVAAALAINVGSAGAPVLFNGAGGTPSSMVGTNITGTAAGLTAGTASAVAVGGITGLGTGVGTWLATPSSANLATAVTGETGTGALVFATSPTLVTPDIGTPSAGVATNLTALNATQLTTGAVPAARMPALTGDCTTTVGTVATTCTGINGVNQNAAWTTYTPTATSQIPGGTPPTFTSTAGRYKQIGKTIILEATVVINVAGTATGLLFITVPSGLSAASNIYVGASFESVNTGKSGAAVIVPGLGTGLIGARDAAAAHYFANGSTVSYGITYEIP
jgi:hypothetical protein